MADALLLITPTCPYCPGMMRILSDLVKQGSLGKLEVVNITVKPEVAAQYGVRSVPWLKLGEFEASGAMDRKEIEKWIALADGRQGHGVMLAEQLQQGGLDDVLALVKRQPEVLADLLSLLNEDDVPLAVRIGVSAAVEAFEEQPEMLRKLVPEMIELTRNKEPATRADACHFLGIAGGEDARTALEACLEDSEGMVREIAKESLQKLERH